MQGYAARIRRLRGYEWVVLSRFSSMALFKSLLGFLAFAVLYYLPKALEGGALVVPEQRVRLLLEQALAVPTLRLDVLVNLLGHLFVLLLCYLLLGGLARRFSQTMGLARSISYVVVFGAAWVFMLATNRMIFPLSDYSYGFYDLARPEVAAISGVLLLLILAAVAWSLRGARLLRVGGAVVSLGAAVGVIGAMDFSASAGEQGRNIVIVGIDSLSGAAYERLGQELPSIDRLVKAGTYYPRAYTPLGRTFPAWVSILSGQTPAEHGAYFNLRSLERVESAPLLSRELQEQGYRTVFGLDERRFNNLDERFGFDHVIGPKAGALDFVMQRLNDSPLTNLLLQSPLAGIVLPFSYQNVASYVNYDDDAFVDSVLGAVQGADKVFLAVHFESAHFPFKSRHVEHHDERADDFWPRHVGTLKVVDRQISQLMAGLKSQGVLDDALVIVLSDHGEGLGLLEATVTRAGEPNEVQTYGHGSSLLSDHQSRIILATLEFKDGRPVERVARHEEQVSLLDLKSLMSAYVEKGVTNLTAGSECLFVETGIRFSAMADYKTLNKEDLAAQSAGYYEIGSRGHLQLKESGLPELVHSKDVGLRCRDRITYFSSIDNRFYAYALSENGIVERELEPVAADVRRIEGYRKQYIAQVQR